MVDNTRISNFEKFKLAFDTLKSSCDRTRSIIYVSIILNFSLFIFSLSVSVYNPADDRLNRAHDALSCVGDLWNPDWDDGNRRTHCADLFASYRNQGINFYTLIESRSIPPNRVSLDGIRARMIEQRATQLIEQSLLHTRYKFPLFGIEIDIAWSWIVISFVSIATSLITLNSIIAENEALELTILAAGKNNFLKKMVITTQVITPPKIKNDRLSEWRDYIRVGLVVLLVLLPVFSQIISVIYESIDINRFFMILNGETKIFHIISALCTFFALVVTSILVFQIFQNLGAQSRRYEGLRLLPNETPE